MNKKILTFKDFCDYLEKQNKTINFSSEGAGFNLSVATMGKFEVIEDKHSEGLMYCKVRAFHDLTNANKSAIDTEVLEENIVSMKDRPIMADIIETTDEEGNTIKDFSGHTMEIEEETGKIKYIELPVGHFVNPEDFHLEYDEEYERNFVIADCVVYEEYTDTCDILRRRGTVDCSVELCVRDMEYDAKDKVLKLNDFYVQGCTLLGENIAPGMPGSKVTLSDFSEKNNSVFSQDNAKLIEMLEQLNEKINNLSNFAINNNVSEKGGNSVTKFEEMLKKYNITAEEVTFEYADLTDEEIEAKFAETFGKDNEEGESNKGVTPSVELSKEELFQKLFEISFEETRYALNTLCSMYRTDKEWCYVHEVYESYFIMEDWDSGNYYKQSYTKEGDNVAFSGDRERVYSVFVTEEEKASLEEMRANYSSYSSISEKLAAYEKAELDAQKEQIFGKENYSKYLECEEFVSLKADMDKYSVEELEEKAELAFAKCVQKLGFSLEETEPSKKTKRVSTTTSYSEKTETSYKPYGDLFDEK